MRNLFIVILLTVVFVLGNALVLVENERYALWLGMCPNMDQTFQDIRAGNADAWKCMKTVETRTAWWWHLYYALTDRT